MPLGQRIALVALASTLLGLLATAETLTPDARGYGTHEQLGLPPCTFSVIFQRPCPACGMTTSWAWLVRGDIRRALAANTGGTLLAVLSLASAPWLLVSALRGRWLGGRPNEWAVAGVAALVCLVTLGQWGWRLWMF